MPRPFRIAQDTGQLEYDDSAPHIEGKCPECGHSHMGAWDVCDDCIAYKVRMQREWEEAQEEQFYDEYEKWSQDD